MSNQHVFFRFGNHDRLPHPTDCGKFYVCFPEGNFNKASCDKVSLIVFKKFIQVNFSAPPSPWPSTSPRAPASPPRTCQAARTITRTGTINFDCIRLKIKDGLLIKCVVFSKWINFKLNVLRQLINALQCGPAELSPAVLFLKRPSALGRFKITLYNTESGKKTQVMW